MCGIVGILGSSPVAGTLLEALKRLEYRGYDSAGIATLENGRITRRRAAGKLKDLQACVRPEPLFGKLRIRHTSSATHGRRTADNAHPHQNGKGTVVHSGMIETFRAGRAELPGTGHHFSS